MSIGSKIAKHRKRMSITQDALAQKLGVTNQAVSKWELDQACPDIQLLPQLADIFGTTIDELFDRAPQPTAATVVSGLPWQDDSTLRAVLYVGHTLVGHDSIDQVLRDKEITFTYEGPALNVDSYFSVSCGDVQGDVDAGTAVSCGNVCGDVDAGTSVTCANVDGDVDAGSNVSCGDVGGDVDAGSMVNCGSVGGDVDAGASVKCGEVSGSVDAGGSVTIVK